MLLKSFPSAIWHHLYEGHVWANKCRGMHFKKIFNKKKQPRYLMIPSNINFPFQLPVPSSAALANLMRSCFSLVTTILPSREEKISDPLLNQLIWGLGMPSALQVRVVALFRKTIRSPCIYLTLGGTEWKENLDNNMQFR